MIEMPNRQFWVEAAIWGVLTLVIGVGLAVFDVTNGFVRIWLVGPLPLVAVYAHQYVEWRRRRRLKVSEKTSRSENSN